VYLKTLASGSGFANMNVSECPVALYCPLLLITVVMAIMSDMKMQRERESE